MLIFIRGAGDLATGIACRLFRSGFFVVMADIPLPTAIRRTVSFSTAIQEGEATVEGIRAKLAQGPEEALNLIREGKVAVLVDPEGRYISALKPEVVVDAIMAKKNLGTRKEDAPNVIGIGPGFQAGEDCHAAIETQRGHDLGRVLYEGSPMPNTGIPGNVGGVTTERLIRSTADGVFTPMASIGDIVEAGQTVAHVEGVPVQSSIHGILRGILPEGTVVTKGMKAGDVDPRCTQEHCHTVSDKALAIGGGVLEAILNLSKSGSRL
jgi:xanthine dehydrogenase accessory factor